jgi:hypothetical protein
VNVTRLIPAVVFIAIFVAHALYVSACSASAPSGWTDFGISAHVAGPLGLGAYWRGQDYFIGFSYALAAAFATWARSVAASSFVKKGPLPREPLPAG